MFGSDTGEDAKVIGLRLPAMKRVAILRYPI